MVCNAFFQKQTQRQKQLKPILAFFGSLGFTCPSLYTLTAYNVSRMSFALLLPPFVFFPLIPTGSSASLLPLPLPHLRCGAPC
jgi:hypothetical protein